MTTMQCAGSDFKKLTPTAALLARFRLASLRQQFKVFHLQTIQNQWQLYIIYTKKTNQKNNFFTLNNPSELQGEGTSAKFVFLVKTRISKSQEIRFTPHPLSNKYSLGQC